MGFLTHYDYRLGVVARVNFWCFHAQKRPVWGSAYHFSFEKPTFHDINPIRPVCWVQILGGLQYFQVYCFPETGIND